MRHTHSGPIRARHSPRSPGSCMAQHEHMGHAWAVATTHWAARPGILTMWPVRYTWAAWPTNGTTHSGTTQTAPVPCDHAYKNPPPRCAPAPNPNPSPPLLSRPPHSHSPSRHRQPPLARHCTHRCRLSASALLSFSLSACHHRCLTTQD
jgi:hypothetical protein